MALAAVPTLPDATSFFRTPESQFKSGQTSRFRLELTQLRTDFRAFSIVEWNKKTYTLGPEDLLLDLHCQQRGQAKAALELLAEPKQDAPRRGRLEQGQEVDILQIRGHWVQVRSSQKKVEGWVIGSQLHGINEDLGLFVPLIDTFLRDKPGHDGRVLTTIPRRQRLTYTRIFDSGWLEVSHRGRRGYVDLHHLTHRSDFADWAWIPGTGWVLVSHREGGHIKTRDGRSFALRLARGFTPHLGRGIVVQSESSNSPPLRARVDIRRQERVIWAASLLPGHGEVWWQKSSNVVEETPLSTAALSTEELLKRDVYSYALNGSKKPQGLVSAKGIWRTLDGLRWSKIDQFGDQDLPVALHSNGLWIVGAYQSTDQGLSFEPYIKWDDLTRSVEKELLRPPRYLKIQQVEALPSSKVQLLVDTGVRRLKLRGHLDGRSWSVAR